MGNYLLSLSFLFRILPRKQLSSMKQLINELEKTEHGFKHIIDAGDKLLQDKSLDHLDIATEFLTDESYQARMLATYLLGQLAYQNKAALQLLRTHVSRDTNWRVQEMLAKAFDQYCKTKGYELALPVITEWLDQKNPNLTRSVIEGLRIWTSRPYFRQNPEVAIRLISNHKSDESEYVRKSVGNALRDISKKNKELVRAETEQWDLTDHKIAFTYKLVNKNL
jgi:3-methyladenine DNA glycosylase AlkD